MTEGVTAWRAEGSGCVLKDKEGEGAWRMEEPRGQRDLRGGGTWGVEGPGGWRDLEGGRTWRVEGREGGLGLGLGPEEIKASLE